MLNSSCNSRTKSADTNCAIDAHSLAAKTKASTVKKSAATQEEPESDLVARLKQR